MKQNKQQITLSFNNGITSNIDENVFKLIKELEKLKKSQEISDRRLEQKMEEIARMKKQGSMELQGEIQEERLQDYLEKKKSPPKTTIEEACKHASQREQLATRAERDSIKYMQMVFMEDKVGQEFDGVITGVTDRGMYVEIIENKCEGMIRMVDLKNDFFQYDMQNHSIVGRKTNTIYQLGDPLRIKVKKVNIQRRFLDFITAE